MKFLTVLEYIVDEIKSDLDDIQSTANHTNISFQTAMSIKQIISSIKDKLNVICE